MTSQILRISRETENSQEKLEKENQQEQKNRELSEDAKI
jgi:hypothetical protein